MIDDISKNFTLYYKNINFQDFSNIIIETQMIYINCLENKKEI